MNDHNLKVRVLRRVFMASSQENRLLENLRGVLYTLRSKRTVRDPVDGWQVYLTLQPFLQEARRSGIVTSYIEEFLSNLNTDLEELEHEFGKAWAYVEAAKVNPKVAFAVDGDQLDLLKALGGNSPRELVEVIDSYTAGESYPDTTSGEIIKSKLKPWLEPFGWKQQSGSYEAVNYGLGPTTALVSPKSSEGLSNVSIMGSFDRPEDQDLEQISEDVYYGDDPDVNFANQILFDFDSKRSGMIDLVSGGFS